MVESEGFKLEEHQTRTEDGFILVLHRIVPLKPRETNGDDAAPPVLVMHGLMQDSEALLAGGREHALGLWLASRGYDVFLGNNRGNRYSHKHLSWSPHDEAYWNFSIDELARYDVPALVGAVLGVTRAPRLAYVGFSQGSAQMFAALSADTALQARVALFAALSPAARAKGLSKSVLTTLVQTNLRFINVLFGRRRMLPMTVMWQNILSRTQFVRAIDCAMWYLFSWSNSQVSHARKCQLYPHIYSFASVKCVVHWFQMIRSRRLAMFDDTQDPAYAPVSYDITLIRCPVAVMFGGRDLIVECESLSAELPNCVLSHCEDKYEHLDTMWADTAKDAIFPRLHALLRALPPQS
ncbi:lipase [Tribonema minus]|uniref:Lipase n=1 Tax=Tribonema minus TaxID=303371 RepID=A0A836CJG0_9STRA|nr:lipase [Tribonema minus]